jgi:putative endonuclease
MMWGSSQTVIGALPARVVGTRAEEMAVAYLQECGYQLVAQNFTAILGHTNSGQAITGEIDIIAWEAAVLCFVEVKARRLMAQEVGQAAGQHQVTAQHQFTARVEAPELAVDQVKQQKLRRTARYVRRMLGLSAKQYRFDVVAITFAADGRPTIRLRRDYFPA